jgi:hypothetical protein
MAIPPIFKFKNIKVKLTTDDPTFIYGVNSYVAGNNTLDSGIAPADITSIALTVQISNLSTSTVLVDVLVQNSQSLTFDYDNAHYLVKAYPLVPANAFDPLSGNLSLGANDQIWVTSNTVNGCDVVVSLLEIANATAS